MDLDLHTRIDKVQQSDPPSTRFELSCVADELEGKAGAEKIVFQLDSQLSGATKLILNHNPLGDAGVSHLFDYLCSTAGSRHRMTLSEISLNCSNFGCKGLQAISNYIQGNIALKDLWLASNVLTADPATFSSLASAINDSKLRFISFTSNNKLGDAFVEQLFPLLRSRYLQELHINSIGLTTRSVPTIAAWISGNLCRPSGGVCYLQTFKSSGNSLGANGVWEIVRAIERGNWGITKVEIHANQLAASPNLPPNETENTMKDAERALHRVLMRNCYWKRQTEKEALLLLRYSRSLLMHPRYSSKAVRTLPSPLPISASFTALPIELKLCIIGLLSPSLSPAQRMRIYNYASDPTTLPCLLPALGHSGKASGLNGGGQRFSGGKYVGSKSLLCLREEERNKFLEATGCCTYEPNRKEE